MSERVSKQVREYVSEREIEPQLSCTPVCLHELECRYVEQDAHVAAPKRVKQKTYLRTSMEQPLQAGLAT